MAGGDLSVASGSRTKTWVLDGKEYTAQTLRLRQWASLEEWARNKILDEAKRLVNGLNDRQLAKELMDEARIDAKRVSVTTPGFLGGLQNFEGIQQLVWLSISRAHPTVSLSQAGDLVDLDKSLTYMEDFFYLNENTVKIETNSGNSVAADSTP